MISVAISPAAAAWTISSTPPTAPFLFGGHGFDTITDFDPRGRDGDLITLMINSAFGVFNFQQLRAGMQQNGNTIMDFGNGDVLVLLDVRIAELSA